MCRSKKIPPTPQILAHNDDKRKKIMFDAVVERAKKGLCCFSYAIWVGQKGADHGDGVSAGSITSRALDSDTADSHQREVTDSLPDGPQSFETKHRSGVALRRGREDWTDGEIVDRKLQASMACSTLWVE